MPIQHQNGKGSKRRPGSLKAYEDGWDRIYGKKNEDIGDMGPADVRSRPIKKSNIIIKTPSCCTCKFWIANFEGSINGKCSGRLDPNFTSVWDYLCDNFKKRKLK